MGLCPHDRGDGASRRPRRHPARADRRHDRIVSRQPRWACTQAAIGATSTGRLVSTSRTGPANRRGPSPRARAALALGVSWWSTWPGWRVGALGGEAAFDLTGRAAAEHLDQVGVQGQQAWAGFGTQVGVEHGRGEGTGGGPRAAARGLARVVLPAAGGPVTRTSTRGGSTVAGPTWRGPGRGWGRGGWEGGGGGAGAGGGSGGGSGGGGGRRGRRPRWRPGRRRSRRRRGPGGR
jgi:hypothetical protein